MTRDCIISSTVRAWRRYIVGRLGERPASDSVTEDEIKEARKMHLQKLAVYRKQKEWETWCEEDDFDREGERVLAEIKNYKEETTALGGPRFN